MLTLNRPILFQVLPGKVLNEKLYDPTTSWLVEFFYFLFFYNSFYIIRTDFYNFLELYYSTLFEIEKTFSTDSYNPLNNQNLLNVFCQSALSLPSIKPTTVSLVVLHGKILWKLRKLW